MKSHAVTGGGGLRLHVREWGNENAPPLLFIHGWSQCHLSWVRQCVSALADEFRIIAFDLRGHGMSEAPTAEERYTNGDEWADDVAAILNELSLVRPVIVGSSYGGCIIADYVRKHGDRKLAGINFVAAAVILGKTPLIGPAFFEHARGACSDDLPTNIAAMRSFIPVCFGPSISAEDFETVLAYNMVVRPTVRRYLLKRSVDFTEILERVSVPVLVSHGRADTLVLPAMSDHILNHCKTAIVSWYDGVHHAPFFEEPARFNGELAEFAHAANNR